MKRKIPFLALIAFFALGQTLIVAQNKLSESEHADLVYSYLDGQKSRYGFADRDIEDLRITNQFYSKTTKITHLYLNQAHNGIRIHNGISSVALKDGKVFYFANRIKNNANQKVNAVSPANDVKSALNQVNWMLNLGAGTFTEAEANGNSYQFLAGDLVSSPIEAELVYVEVDGQLRLAWDFTIYLDDNSHWWSIRMDAMNNNMIEQFDLILTCNFGHPEGHKSHKEHNVFEAFAPAPMLGDAATYNVYPMPVESPNHGNRALVSDPSDPDASPFGWHDNDGVDGPEFTITRGNNVWAREDRDANNLGGYAPDGGNTLTFDYSLDLNDSPIDYEDAAITNLFYWNNIMHDVWYKQGFDEASGNFQAKNYDGSFGDRDFVIADAQDGNGFNNANFGTPGDGASPRMQMFLWIGASNPSSVNNGALAGDYDVVPAAFGEVLTQPLTANLALAQDGTSDFNDICQTITNSAQLNGRIAVIRRGECEFGSKILKAQNAGAVAVVMVNNVAGDPISMGPGAEGGAVTIPSVMINQADGEAIIAALENNQSLSFTMRGPDLIDGDFDNGIIAHEYGHGISNRLTGGSFAFTCLQNLEQMGEGWSDWFGLMLTMRDEDTAEKIRGIGTFPTGQPTDGVGIRPAPYTTNTGVNGFTYANTNEAGVSVPHGVGFVWATALWDLTWAYIDKYGFDSDFYNGDGGNNKVMKLVIDGLKLQPCSPGFIDGRDALLAADMATTGGEDQCMIWEVFAARGMGFDADQGSSGSRGDQTEDFTMPPANDPSLANCDQLLSTGQFDQNTLSIYPNPTQSELFIDAKTSLGDVTIRIVDINGRVVLNKNAEIFDLYQLDISGFNSGIYFLTIKGDQVTYNHKIIKN
ncbi:T9SS-dependent M36 family metallopeptidase [Winogradskyella aurantiaca]|uniref:T9SS-dependent M36 family metallopeptidase n=1 Tax=Winogradskyella aurantiaca TaxID=2219558 RepID=UPI000E1CF523|nr:T9SS-dependent M36 family metallopeptidase [Winogradskyella aurantiaca]